MDFQRPWVAHGSETAEHEDHLIGNRAGLEALKSAIEIAIQRGQAPIREGGIEFMGVRVVDEDPRRSSGRATFVDKLFVVGLIVLLAACAFVFFVGLGELPRFFR